MPHTVAYKEAPLFATITVAIHAAVITFGIWPEEWSRKEEWNGMEWNLGKQESAGTGKLFTILKQNQQ